MTQNERGDFAPQDSLWEKTWKQLSEFFALSAVACLFLSTGLLILNGIFAPPPGPPGTDRTVLRILVELAFSATMLSICAVGVFLFLGALTRVIRRVFRRRQPKRGGDPPI